MQRALFPAPKILWWPGTESNRRRQPFQGCALPTELPGRNSAGTRSLYHSNMLRARFAALCLLPTILSAADPPHTRNVILVTADGLRWQDLLHGIDPILAHEKSVSMAPANKDADNRRARYANRESLLPFFWNTIAKKGLVLTDVNVTNAYRVSYPGYSEILTGRASDGVIKGNDPIQQPNETVLEFLKGKLSLPKDRVALFSS